VKIRKIARMKKRQRSNTQPSPPSHKKYRQTSPHPFTTPFKTTFSPAFSTPFIWTPQPAVRSSPTSSILLQEMMTEMKEQREILTTLAMHQQEMMTEMKEQREILTTLAMHQQEMSKVMKKIILTLGLDDSKPEMMDNEYNYYA
jgi:hypothetical protein